MNRSGLVHKTTAAVLLALSILVVVFSVAGAQGEFRLVITALFALTAPGWAVAAFWRPATLALEWTVATCVSIAITILISTLMLLSSNWYPEPVMVALAAVTALAIGYHLMRTDLAVGGAS